MLDLGKDRDPDLSIWVLVYKMYNIQKMDLMGLFFSSAYTKSLTNKHPVLYLLLIHKQPEPAY